MKAIIGLGNPGKKYVNTRHNAGYLLIDVLIHKCEGSVKTDVKPFAEISHVVLMSQKILVVRPTTFMNESGKAAKIVMDKYGIKDLNDICIVHDDLDLTLGNYKIQKGKGPKVHNGVASVESTIGKDFWRIRIGVDNRDPDSFVKGESYVLQAFSNEEKPILEVLYGKIIESFELTTVLGLD